MKKKHTHTKKNQKRGMVMFKGSYRFLYTLLIHNLGLLQSQTCSGAGDTSEHCAGMLYLNQLQ